MTQPYPPQYPAAPQQAPVAPPQYTPQPGYPQNQGAYPVAPPAGPQYAQAPQGYAQPVYPVAPPQYGPPQGYPQQAPAPQMPVGSASLDSYYSQPSAGWGPAWQLGNAVQNGTAYIGIVAQWITKTHLEFATQKNPVTQVEEVRRFKNGDPVVNMKVPLNVVPDGRFTEGRAQFYVGPAEKDLLGAAIAAAGGDPTQPPPLGSMIRATKTGSRGNNFGGQSAIKSVEYWPPGPEAMQYAASLGISYPDLSTPRPVDDGPRHAAPEANGGDTGGNLHGGDGGNFRGGDGSTGGNFVPAPASAGPAVQQQAAPPQPVGQVPAQQMPPAPAGPPAGLPPAPAPQTPPVAAPMGGPPAPGQVPNDPAKADLLARLTGQAPQAQPQSVA